MEQVKKLQVVIWIGAAAYMFYVFIDLTFLIPNDGDDVRTLIDRGFSFVFLFLGLYLLYAAWDAYKAGRLERVASVQKPTLNPVAKTYEPDAEVQAYMRSKMEALVSHGLLESDILENIDYKSAVRSDKHETDLSSFMSLLSMVVSRKQTRTSNIYYRQEHNEVCEDDYAQLLSQCAHMLELDNEPSNVSLITDKNYIGSLSFDFQEAHHEFPGEYPAKYFCWDVMLAIFKLLESRSRNRKLIMMYVDSNFCLAGLLPDQLSTLNVDFHGKDVHESDKFFFASNED